MRARTLTTFTAPLPGAVPRVSAGPSGTGGRTHLFLPFVGGPDDRRALQAVVRMAAREGVSGTVVRFVRVDEEEAEGEGSSRGASIATTPSAPSTR